MTKKIKGIDVQDYMSIDIYGLTEIIALDNQLIEGMRDSIKATEEHRDYAQKCLDEQFYRMECHEASTHFEDYMNVPFPEVQKNHFANMFGTMLTPDGREPDVIDGRDKTLCMYDYAKEIIDISEDTENESKDN